MKEKAFKVIGIVLSIAIFVGANEVYVMFFGHPIYKYHLVKLAEKYIEETYSGTDYETNGVYIREGEGKRVVGVISPSQEDVKFDIYCDFFGAKGDTYESDVLSGKVTSDRAVWEYGITASSLFSNQPFDYKVKRASGVLTVGNNKDEKGSMFMGDFEPNEELDLVEIGEKGGNFDITIYCETITAEELSNALLAIKSFANENGLGFYTISCRMVSETSTDSITIKDFLNQDIKDDEEFRTKVVENSKFYTYELEG